MKLQVNKRMKIGLILILGILISTISFLLYRQVRISKYEEQKTPVYTYNNKGSANYTVFLKPNDLYEGNSLEEGKLYITEFVDYIKTDFSYEFIGERAADLKGKYEILAKVQGFTGDGEKIKNIWEKDYVIVKNKSFNIKETTKVITEEVKLDLEPYNEFITEIKKVSKINSQTMVTLVMNVTVEGITDKGPIEETISPSLAIPLDTAMFEISGNTNIEKPGAIEETKQVQLPVNKRQVIVYGVIIGILLIILILLIFFTKEASIKDPLEKKLKVIFKKHGDRLVALSSDLAITNININQVKSIDDLVKIADEIGKPIMYKYSKDYKDINKFYLINGDQAYVLELNGMSYKVESKIES